MGLFGRRAWLSFVSEYPNLVNFFAHDFPRGGTWNEYKAWLHRVRDGTRGDPSNPRWELFFNGAFPLRVLDDSIYSTKERAYQIYRKAVSEKPEDLWNERRKYDMYVFPTGYIFVLPRNPYGWGFLLGLTVGVAYMVASYFHRELHPVHVWIIPSVLLRSTGVPFHISAHRYSPLGIRGAPKSDEYAFSVDIFRYAMFAMRPFGVLPDGKVVIGYYGSEQQLTIGRLGKEIFLVPSTVSVYRMLFKLADISAFLSEQIFGRVYMGPHSSYSEYAIIDYALTMFHTLLLADFPAYRASISFMYWNGIFPDQAPKIPPAHDLVFKTTGNAVQLPDIVSALPSYVGYTYFPELGDKFELSNLYKEFT